MTEFVLVTIKSIGRIPFLNRQGPISSPISIAKDTYDTLKSMGYQMVLHDKAEVTIDRNTGKRVAITNDNFVPHSEGTFIEVDTTEPEPALVPVTENQGTVTEVVQIPHSEESEETDTTDEELSNDEDSNTEEEETGHPDENSDEESTDIDVFDIEVYKTWTKAQLLTYLRKAEEYLPADVVTELASANKNRLLEIVEKEIIAAAQ